MSASKVLAAIVCAAAVLAGAGCTSVTLAIANLPARFGDYAVERDIVYASDPELRLDVYRPVQTSTAPRPLVVFFHGGGWTTGDKSQYRFVAEALLSRGYVVVVPTYRLYPSARFAGFLADASRAVAWAHVHASQYGADAAQLFVMGHSAGAHIAAMVSFDERFLAAQGGQTSWIRGFIGLAGPYDFLPLTDEYLKDVFGPAEKYPDSQPINFVDGKEPPALLLHGLGDSTVWPRNSERLSAKIRAHGGNVTEHYYEGMTHGGILGALSIYLRSRRTVLDDIAAFVEEKK